MQNPNRGRRGALRIVHLVEDASPSYHPEQIVGLRIVATDAAHAKESYVDAFARRCGVEVLLLLDEIDRLNTRIRDLEAQ